MPICLICGKTVPWDHGHPWEITYTQFPKKSKKIRVGYINDLQPELHPVSIVELHNELRSEFDPFST